MTFAPAALGRIVLAPLALACALAAAAPAAAHSEGKKLSCDVGSDYSVRPYRNAFLFSRDAEPGPAREIGIGGDRLFVDGREVVLSDADKARIRAMGAEMQALVPEVQKVTVEAVDIAFTALTEVARGLAADPGQTVASLEASRRKVRARMAAQPLAIFDEGAMAGIVEPLVREYMPEIVSGAVRTAIKAAFATGKEAGEFEARMQRMERELDARVERRADALEPLAESMCARLRRIDALDDALEARDAEGKPFDLLHMNRRHSHGEETGEAAGGTLI
jgi:hypothetical protein